MEKNNYNYHEQKYIDITLRLREVLNSMAPFVKDFFRAIEPTTSAKTRISYAYDIRLFFKFLLENNPSYKSYTLKSFTPSDLEDIKPVDIEEYMEYLKVYVAYDGKRIINGEKGIARKISSLRSFYSYYYKHQIIEKNPTNFVDLPKIHEKNIIKLDADEVAILLDYVESCGEKLTGQKKTYYEKTKYRDIAILTLLLGTGLRVSECVGLDIDDIDFKNNALHILRKGGNEMVVYFGEEVERSLRSYLVNTRNHLSPKEGFENALFLSTQKRRMCVQAVENVVKKYSSAAIPGKKITPHKLRSTYGTALYQETGDIYLVADVLGHKDVNTTKKHYAAIDDSRRRKAAGAVILREEKENNDENR